MGRGHPTHGRRGAEAPSNLSRSVILRLTIATPFRKYTPSTAFTYRCKPCCTSAVPAPPVPLVMPVPERAARCTGAVSAAARPRVPPAGPARADTRGSALLLSSVASSRNPGGRPGTLAVPADPQPECRGPPAPQSSAPPSQPGAEERWVQR